MRAKNKLKPKNLKRLSITKATMNDLPLSRYNYLSDKPLRESCLDSGGIRSNASRLALQQLTLSVKIIR